MWSILLKIITFLHMLLILFIICAPFTNSNFILVLHFIITPFIILHWLLNDNSCCLTLVEKFIRKKIYNQDDEDCLTCKLIEPIYDFKNNYAKFSAFIYIVTGGLWIISASKLVSRYMDGSISSLRDL